MVIIPSFVKLLPIPEPLITPDLINNSADFGTPEESHDNTVEFENSKNISRLISEDYFTDSILPCDNTTSPGNWMIYCSGKLLQAVMSVKLYNDSKTFLDQPMKQNTTGPMIMRAFHRTFSGPIENIRKEELKKFVDKYFDKEGNELDVCELPEWAPKQFSGIKDETYNAFAQRIHFIWIQLCRKMKEEVKDEQNRFSLLYVPNSFIIPGGRFREFYYWDAYWIIKGLLASQLYSTARNMISNFGYIIEKHGFIPNGGRVYYLRRSQPPMFAPMVYEYFMATDDLQFVADMIPLIEKEYTFWNNHRSVNVTKEDDIETTYNMFQYRTESQTPRPESFREDVLSAQHLHSNSSDSRRKFFQNIASAAESGWDFSSRWFSDGQNMSTIETIDIVPVDLNAFICYNMNILSFFYSKLGNRLKHDEWAGRYNQFRDFFTQVFYVSSRRGWYDYNLRTQKHNTEFYPTIAAPLFAQCYDPLNTKLAVDVYNQIEEMGALKWPGGIPTSLRQNTSQQWDFPNGWSPLVHMVIEGFRKSLNPVLQQKAYEIAKKWLETNILTFNISNAMWEKYDVKEPDAKLATGGEYEVQAGFGWTNGAALDLMLTYSDRLNWTGPRLENLVGPKTTTTIQTTHDTITTTSSSSSSSTPVSSSNTSKSYLIITITMFIMYIGLL
ncbi:unnamed protein product [Caenorhabditis angaria]|uniref:Trehalase n=1 Tax=Caenorhabditis angaria TaxID=860376 RepID=A0A9P1IAE7_9PELO|nr:unnamed protein product [Caenorhabditis angaria]